MDNTEFEWATLGARGVTSAKGLKFDSDKPRMDLLPPRAIVDVAKVLTFGAKKYAPGNWKHVENAEERYMAAALRHLMAHQAGELTDPESGLSHLSHATTCLLFIQELSHG